MIYFSISAYFVLIYLSDAQVASRPTETKKSCPYDESEWNERAANMFCQGLDSYHCFLAEDGISVKESCIERTLILNGNALFLKYFV